MRLGMIDDGIRKHKYIPTISMYIKSDILNVFWNVMRTKTNKNRVVSGNTRFLFTYSVPYMNLNLKESNKTDKTANIFTLKT